MGRDFFREQGQLPSIVTLAFDAIDQDEMDRHEAKAAARRARRGGPKAADKSGSVAALGPKGERGRGLEREDSSRPAPPRGTFDLRTLGGRALVTGFVSGAAGFIGIARFAVPFQVSLLFGLVAVAVAVVSVPAVSTAQRRLALRRARRPFEVSVSTTELVVRSAKTVLRQWRIDAVSAVRVERGRLVVDGTDGASRILPIRFLKDEDVAEIVERTRALLKEAREARKKSPSGKT